MIKHHPVRIAAALVGMCALSLGLRAGPVAEPDALVSQLGKVQSDDTAKCEFRIRNVGDAPLALTAIRTTCGDCLRISASSTAVQPGGESVLAVTMDTARLAGPVRKRFYVQTDDPENALLRFTVAADVTPAYVLTPGPTMDLGQVQPGVTPGKQFRLALAGGSAFAITGVDAPDGLSVEVATAGSTESHSLTASVKADGSSRPFLSGVLVVQTDSAETSRMAIPFAARLVRPITAIPPVLVFRIPSAADDAGPELAPARLKLILKGAVAPTTDAGRSAFSVTGAEPPSRAIAVSVTEPQAAPIAQLTVSASTDAPDGEAGDLVVHTSHTDMPKVSVPIRVIRADGDTAAAPARARSSKRVCSYAEIIDAVAADYGLDRDSLASNPGRSEASGVVAWLLGEVGKPGEARRHLAGADLARQARARDRVTGAFRDNPALARRCKRLADALMTDAAAR